MELTVKGTLESLDCQCDNLKALADKFERTDELEAICDEIDKAQAMVNDVRKMIADIDCAKRSLEVSGFSQEWVDLVNADGNLGKLIDFNKPVYFGGYEAKKLACLEDFKQLATTFFTKLWEYLKQFFAAIVKAIDFVYSNYVRESSKAHEADVEFLKRFAENNLGKLSFESYDVDALIRQSESLSVFLEALKESVNDAKSHFTSYGYLAQGYTKKDFLGVLSCKMIERGLRPEGDIGGVGIKVTDDSVEFTRLEKIVPNKTMSINNDLVDKMDILHKAIISWKSTSGFVSAIQTAGNTIKKYTQAVSAKDPADRSANESSALELTHALCAIIKAVNLRVNEFISMRNAVRTKYRQVQPKMV